MGTFTGTTIQWFNGLPDGYVTSFAKFAKLFREQFYENRVKPPVLYDLFNVRQREWETLKDYQNRFWALIVTLQTHYENVMVFAFEQGVAPTIPLSETRLKPFLKLGKTSRPMRVNETSIGKKVEARQHPYRKETKRRKSTPNFVYRTKN